MCPISACAGRRPRRGHLPHRWPEPASWPAPRQQYFRPRIAGKAGARLAFVLSAAGRRPIPAGEVVPGDTGPDAGFRAGRKGGGMTGLVNIGQRSEAPA